MLAKSPPPPPRPLKQSIPFSEILYNPATVLKVLDKRIHPALRIHVIQIHQHELIAAEASYSISSSSSSSKQRRKTQQPVGIDNNAAGAEFAGSDPDEDETKSVGEAHTRHPRFTAILQRGGIFFARCCNIERNICSKQQ